MATFSPTDAAFEGFRLTRERPRAVIAWAICYLAYACALVVVAMLTLGPQWQALIIDSQNVPNQPAAFWAAWQKLTPFFLAGLPISLSFQAIFTCAVYRAVLRPREARAGYLRVGADELRMVALNLILSVIWAATLFAVLLVTGLAADSAARGAESGAVLVGEVANIIVACAAVLVLIRLSLAGPMTFAERRLRIFESWALTRGCFWRLFWAYLLAFLLAVAVLLLMFLLVSATLGVVAQVSGLQVSAIGQLSSNPLLLGIFFFYQLASVLMVTCFWVVFTAPPAQAYKDLVGGRYPG